MMPISFAQPTNRFGGSCPIASLLLLAGLTPTLFAEFPPPGAYHESCRGDSFDGTVLKAQCKDFFGAFTTTSLNVPQCRASIENVDGALRCVVSELHIAGNNAPFFDIISVVRDETVNGIETKVLRIDRPRVWASPTRYPISFKDGDKITFNAGGCVQTGGAGRTWKSYVFPDGVNGQSLYSGWASIPGVTGTNQRIGGLMYEDWSHKENGLKVWQVLRSPNPEVEGDRFLNLGYSDDNLSDNGYYRHDNGNGSQCEDVGPAWVEVTIVSSSITQLTQGLQWSPASKPFDVVWDMNNEDFNGLPLNPRWLSQVSSLQGDTPNFNATCGPAFSSSLHELHLDYDKLNRICTSQMPTMDLYGQGNGATQGVKCPDDPFKGHLNWTIATYVGNITYKEWSNIWPYDDDMNLMLHTTNNIGFTSENLDPAQGVGMWIEFDAGEVFDGSNGWWAKLTNEAETPIASRPPQDTLMNSSGGLLGVVTGLFGIDGVHKGYTELHPAFAIAVRNAEVPGISSNGTPTMVEGWAFFLRNSGDEGSCSSYMHSWDGINGDYFIQLPWPNGATGVTVAAVSELNLWSGSSDKATASLLRSAKPGWTILKVHSPVGSVVGLDGDITLQYTFPAGQKPHGSPPQPPVVGSGRSPEAQMEDFEGRIRDPATKAHFHAALAAALPKEEDKQKTNRKVAVDPIMGIQPHIPGPASLGKLTRERTAPNVEKQKRDAAFEKVVQSFGDAVPTAPLPK